MELTDAWSHGRGRYTVAFGVAVASGVGLIPLPGLAELDLGEEPADAHCYQYFWEGAVDVGWGREEAQYAGTCDNDNYYYGKVNDTLTDGSCVQVQYMDPLNQLSGFLGRSCGGWVNYNWKDQNGDYAADLRFYRNGAVTQYSSPWAPTTGY